MHLAATMSPDPGRIDRALADTVTALLAAGLRPIGVVQINTERPGRADCAMALRILPDGPLLPIHQDLGPGARGCRLDVDALEHAVAEVASRLGGAADLLVVNKFGKHEAEGRGFRQLIGEALARGLPVLTGVNARNRAAFDSFAAGLAEDLPPDPAALVDWCHTARAAAAA